MEKEDNSFRLVITDATKDHAGAYECVVSNASGECSSTATLLVEGTSSWNLCKMMCNVPDYNTISTYL